MLEPLVRELWGRTQPSNGDRGRPDCRMIACRVPIFSSGWRGTGTVTVPESPRETAPIPEMPRQSEADARDAEREWARGAEREGEVDDLVTPVAPQAAATFVETTDTSDREFKRPATSSEEMDQLAAEAAAAMMAREGSGVHVVIRPDRAPSEPEAGTDRSRVGVRADARLLAAEGPLAGRTGGIRNRPMQPAYRA